MTQRKPMRANLIIRTAFICIFIFLFVSVINLQVQMNDLRAERDKLVESVLDKQDQIDELELRIAQNADTASRTKLFSKIILQAKRGFDIWHILSAKE